MSTRLLTTLLALLVLVDLAGAQLSVTPASRTLVLESGASAKVTIDTGDCDPAWAVTSDDTDVVTVAPDAYDNGSKRSFTLTAAEELPAGSATVTVDLDGGKCLAETSAVFTVYVVAVAPKTLTKQFVKGAPAEDVTGTKPRLKTFKNTLKLREKALRADYKDILADLKDGTLALNEFIPAPPGGSVLQPHEIALANALDFESQMADGVWGIWFLTTGGSASDGNDLLSLGGYLSADPEVVAAVTPPDLLRGTDGEWDHVTDTTFTSSLDTMGRAQTEAEKFHGKVEKDSTIGARINSRATPPLDIGPLLDGPSQLGFLPQTSPTLDGRSQLLMLRASNHFDGDTENGRLYMLGRGPALGTMDVTMQRLASGLPTGDAIEREVELVFDTFWRLIEPSTDSAASLTPGTWRVTVSDGTTEATEVIDIPVN